MMMMKRDGFLEHVHDETRCIFEQEDTRGHINDEKETRDREGIRCTKTRVRKMRKRDTVHVRRNTVKANPRQEARSPLDIGHGVRVLSAAL